VSCSARYPIDRGIPRFVSGALYASSFGLQWNRFRLEQIDAASGISLSRQRLLSETGWTLESLSGSWVLDAGCGAGRFLSVAAESGAQVVGLDLSDAVDAAAQTLVGRDNVHLVQGRIDQPPFRAGAFDAAYCIGVIQHTNDPQASVRGVARSVRPGGRIAVTAYERRQFTLLNSKYVVRRLTRRLGDRTLLALVFLSMPILFPLTEVLFRLPLAGRLFRFIIPVANYVGAPQLSLRQRYRWALMDTYDMLAPRYDEPQRESDVRAWLREEGVNVERRPNAGLNLSGSKRAGLT
jgi:SAM-dependent methyltransferase